MPISELTLMLSHPGVAIALAGIFLLVWHRDRKAQFLAFGAAYLLYALGMLAQVLRIPASIPMNIALTGILYTCAILLIYYGLMVLEGVRPRWRLVGALSALFIALRLTSPLLGAPSHLQILTLLLYLSAVLLTGCWQLRYLARATLLESLPFWIVLVFALTSPFRALLALNRGPADYGYDGSSYWVATQLSFNAFIVLLAVSVLLLAGSRNMDRLRQDAHRDPLTRTYNRAGLLEHFRAEQMRGQSRYSLITLDLDHFKRINDTHGHHIGDRMLEAAGRSLEDCTRSTDTVARYGGEEFMVLLPDTGIDVARMIAQRMRREIAAIAIDADSRPVRCTASFGVIEFAAPMELDGAYPLVDALMYAAKNAGRDRICHLPEPLADPGVSREELLRSAQFAPQAQADDLR